MSEILQQDLSPEDVVEAYKKYKAQQMHGRSIATANWVTTLAHDCEAYAVYMRTVPPEKRIPMDTSLGMIFGEGNEQARIVKRDLAEAGFELSSEEGQVSWPSLQITGRRDLKIWKQGMRKRVPVEVKSCAPYTYYSINTADDVKNHKWPFIQKWWKQCILYCVLDSEPEYWLLLKSKSSGQIKIIRIVLDDEGMKEAEVMLKKAEAVNRLVNIGEMPSPSQKIASPDLCPECEMFNVCLPDLDFGIGAAILSGEDAIEFEKMLDRRQELAAPAKEFADLDDELKDEIKRRSSGTLSEFVIGNWIASLKYQEVKPEEKPRKGFTKTIIKFFKPTPKE